MPTLNYIALVRKEPETDYWIDVPDIPGCIAGGETVEQAKALFAEALESHVRLSLEDGWTLPEPRSLEKVLSDEEPGDYVDSYIVEIEPD